MEKKKKPLCHEDIEVDPLRNLLSLYIHPVMRSNSVIWVVSDRQKLDHHFLCFILSFDPFCPRCRQTYNCLLAMVACSEVRCGKMSSNENV